MTGVDVIDQRIKQNKMMIKELNSVINNKEKTIIAIEKNIEELKLSVLELKKENEGLSKSRKILEKEIISEVQDRVKWNTEKFIIKGSNRDDDR